MATTSIATSILRGGIMRRLLRGGGPLQIFSCGFVDHSEGAGTHLDTAQHYARPMETSPSVRSAQLPYADAVAFVKQNRMRRPCSYNVFEASARARKRPMTGDRSRPPSRTNVRNGGGRCGRGRYYLPPYSAPKNSLLASTVGLMVRLPSCQLAGQTSPCFSLNWSAFTMRSASSTLRPSGRSFTT